MVDVIDSLVSEKEITKLGDYYISTKRSCMGAVLKVKEKMRQKAWVEGLIWKSFIEEEASFLFSYYFCDHVNLSFESVMQNDDGIEQDSSESMLSTFR